MTQRVIPIVSPRIIPEEQLTPGVDLATFFPRRQPLALEIGCGIGDFIVPLAQAHPERNFLAIDIYNKGCLKTCRRCDDARLDNVRVARIEARHLIVRHLAPASLCAVYINCPDPWPKKRHRERRLFNAPFLDLLRYALVPGGEVYFASDIADYAEQVAELITPECGFVATSTPTVATELPLDYPVSKYMRRFLERGQPIHFLSLHHSDPPGTLRERPSEVGLGFRTRRREHCHGR